MICYVEINGTCCSLEEGRSVESVYRATLREYGTDSDPMVRKATQEDIDWVRGMQQGLAKEAS